jgi:hypothetical protein
MSYKLSGDTIVVAAALRAHRSDQKSGVCEAKYTLAKMTND